MNNYKKIYDVITAILIMLTAGCSSDTDRTKVLLPNYTPGVEVEGNSLHTVRTGENVEVWYYNRFTDPSKSGMYESGKYYNLVKKSTWNTEPSEEEYREKRRIYLDRAWKQLTYIKQRHLEEKYSKNLETLKQLREDLSTLRKVTENDEEKDKETVEKIRQIEVKIKTYDAELNNLVKVNTEILDKQRDLTEKVKQGNISGEEYRGRNRDLEEKTNRYFESIQKAVKQCKTEINELKREKILKSLKKKEKNYQQHKEERRKIKL